MFSMLLLLLLLGASTLLIPLIESQVKNNGQGLNLVSNSCSHQFLPYSCHLASKRWGQQFSEYAWSLRDTTMHYIGWSLVNDQFSSTPILLLLTKAMSVLSLLFLRWCFSQALYSCGPHLSTLIHLHAKSSMPGKGSSVTAAERYFGSKLDVLVEYSTRLPQAFALNVLFFRRAKLLWIGPDLFLLHAPAQGRFKPFHVLLFV